MGVATRVYQAVACSASARPSCNGGDRLGFAGGWLSASKGFEADSPTLDRGGLDGPDFGYAASGAERLAELYYAWQVNDHLELTPDRNGFPGLAPRTSRFWACAP